MGSNGLFRGTVETVLLAKKAGGDERSRDQVAR
jgi:hypothetical protein